MGEGKGEGDSLDLFPPRLNPLPPAERRIFSRYSIYRSDDSEGEESIWLKTRFVE